MKKIKKIMLSIIILIMIIMGLGGCQKQDDPDAGRLTHDDMIESSLPDFFPLYLVYRGAVYTDMSSIETEKTAYIVDFNTDDTMSDVMRFYEGSLGRNGFLDGAECEKAEFVLDCTQWENLDRDIAKLMFFDDSETGTITLFRVAYYPGQRG